jgi:DNA-binding MarR family transcriptional regulator
MGRMGAMRRLQGEGRGMTQAKLTAEQILLRIAAHWPQADVPAARLMIRVHRLRDLVWASAQAAIRRHGLGPTGFEVLAALRSAPPPWEMRPSEVQAAVLISSGGLTKVLHGLERQGLVVRTGHERDRRTRPARLTPTGAARVEAAMAELRATEEAHLARGLTAEEMTELTALVRKLLQALEPDGPGP